VVEGWEAATGSAEGVGFEPTEALRLQRFSRPPHSTALPPLRANRTEHLRGMWVAAHRLLTAILTAVALKPRAPPSYGLSPRNVKTQSVTVTSRRKRVPYERFCRPVAAFPTRNSYEGATSDCERRLMRPWNGSTH
jgi:hypothetical protein